MEFRLKLGRSGFLEDAPNWWINFVYSNEFKVSGIDAALEQYNGKFIDRYPPPNEIAFDTEQDALYFMLKFS